MTHRAITERLAAEGRHVICEHPRGSESWIQPEFAGAHRLIRDGHLYYVKCHGCALGYRDSESGLPYLKPTGGGPKHAL